MVRAELGPQLFAIARGWAVGGAEGVGKGRRTALILGDLSQNDERIERRTGPERLGLCGLLFPK